MSARLDPTATATSTPTPTPNDAAAERGRAIATAAITVAAAVRRVMSEEPSLEALAVTVARVAECVEEAHRAGRLSAEDRFPVAVEAVVTLFEHAAASGDGVGLGLPRDAVVTLVRAIAGPLLSTIVAASHGDLAINVPSPPRGCFRRCA